MVTAGSVAVYGKAIFGAVLGAGLYLLITARQRVVVPPATAVMTRQA